MPGVVLHSMVVEDDLDRFFYQLTEYMFSAPQAKRQMMGTFRVRIQQL